MGRKQAEHNPYREVAEVDSDEDEAPEGDVFALFYLEEVPISVSVSPSPCLQARWVTK